MSKPVRKSNRSVTALALSLSLGYFALMATLMWMFENAITTSSLTAALENPNRISAWFIIGSSAFAIFLLSSWTLRRMSTGMGADQDFTDSQKLSMILSEPLEGAPTSWRDAVMLMVAVALILAGTGAYIVSEQDKALDAARYRQFSLIGKLKAQSISRWVDERRRDLAVLLENEQFKTNLKLWLRDIDATKTVSDSVHSSMDAVMEANNFDGLSVVDRQGVVRISIPDDIHARRTCRQVAIEGRAGSASDVSLSTTFTVAAGGPKLDVIGTVTEMQGQAGKHYATLCMRVDLNQRLLPMVSAWPSVSRTGEILLGRIDGDDVILLNSRNDNDSAWASKRLIAESGYWEAAREMTQAGRLHEIQNDDGVHKLHAVYEVQNTPWIVMVRMDAEEADQLQSRKQRYATVFVGFVLLFVVAGFSIAWARTHRGREAMHAQRDALLEQLQELAFYDELTGLPSRRLLRDRLDVALIDAARREETLGVMFIDVNNFKTINDTYGHAAGDAVLKAIATRLQACVRQNDTAGRLSGDEYLVIVTGHPSALTLDELRTKISLAVREPVVWDGEQLNVGVSVGVALYPDSGRTSEELIHAADQSMYLNKKDSV